MYNTIYIYTYTLLGIYIYRYPHSIALFHEHPVGEDSERPLAEHQPRPKGGRGGRERLGEEHGDGPLGTYLGTCGEQAEAKHV